MMRWIILAVLVVAISATATLVVQSLPASPSVGGPSELIPAPLKVTDGAKPSGPPPHAVVEGDLTYQFGTKAQRETFTKDWVVRNEGKGDLVLTLANKECSCTSVEVRDKGGKVSKLEAAGGQAILAPGDEATIRLTWETREPHDPKFRKQATIGTNDLQHPKFTFIAEGEVYPAVVVFPKPDIEMVELTTDEESHPARVAVFSPDRPDTKITKISSSNPDLVVASQEPLTEDDCKALKVTKGIRVNVDVKRGLPLGIFREEVVLHTDHPRKPEVRLALSGKMVGPISLIPSMLEMHNVSSKSGNQKEMMLLVRNHRATKFQVESKPEKLKVDVVEGKSDSKVSRYRLIVTVPPGTPAGKVEDQIILKTDHPYAGELRIPVKLFIGDAG